MTVFADVLELETRGEGETHDITAAVGEVLERSGLERGTVTVFVPGSTAGVTTIEYESGAVADLAAAFERLAPRHADYAHNDRWGDGNGYAHVRAALLGPSLSVPFAERQLMLGTWQQIILVDFDNRSRTRRVCCQVVGKA